MSITLPPEYFVWPEGPFYVGYRWWRRKGSKNCVGEILLKVPTLLSIKIPVILVSKTDTTYICYDLTTIRKD